MITEILALNQIWTRAWLDRDAEAVERLMAPGYVYTAPNGQVLDRDEILGIVRSPRYQLRAGARTEVGVTAAGAGVAAVSSRWKGEGTYEGQDFSDDHRCTTVFVRNEGRWQVLVEHSSAITTPPGS